MKRTKQAKRINKEFDEEFKKYSAIVATGKCPTCGQKLCRNYALAGWWQCSGFGAEGFRAPNSTPCNFQCFVE